MSSSRSSHSRQSSTSPNITEDQIIDLISKLQALLPETRIRNTDRASAEKVLKETCRYIKKLQNEVEDLSEKLAELLTLTEETNSAQASVIRSLLM